jgi:hypothetical protein
MIEKKRMTKRLPALRLRLVPLLITLGLGAGAHAQSLVDLYTAARDYDATYQAAKAQQEANVFKADQSMALILPKVGVSATWNSGLSTMDRTFNGNSMTWNDWGGSEQTRCAKPKCAKNSERQSSKHHPTTAVHRLRQWLSDGTSDWSTNLNLRYRCTSRLTLSGGRLQNSWSVS